MIYLMNWYYQLLEWKTSESGICRKVTQPYIGM